MFATRALRSRSIWKGPNIVPLPIPQLEPGKRPPPIKTQARAATIMPYMVGLRFQIHNGKIYHEISVTEDMVGRKLGEFSPTRKRFTFKMTRNK